MEHIHSLAEIKLERPSIVTIGAFDGVHRGHQYLIEQQVQLARQRDAAAVVLTFFPHPDRVLRAPQGPYYLTTPDERAALIGSLGVDLVVTLPFDDALRHTRAADFVKLLIDRLNLHALWVGPDFALGYRREGDVPFLKALGERLGFAVRVVDVQQTRDGEAISSTAIREALRKGEVERAARYLGRPYRITGTVVEGRRRGQKLGFPTANLQVWHERMIPAAGVYAGWAWVGDRRYATAANIGVRPTFQDDASQSIEAHLLDYDGGDLYGWEIALEFVGRLRGEQRFESVEALRAQIAKDVTQTRALLGVAAPTRPGFSGRSAE